MDRSELLILLICGVLIAAVLTLFLSPLMNVTHLDAAHHHKKSPVRL